ncbi:MAG: PSD1 and planctomycete cytochrome C domain-containing protein [Verrucomicrobiota bacterium]|nr:PSD1 and planctomycete cytochrome C domain-containing protein [Verrucomicrobiota bacterium]
MKALFYIQAFTFLATSGAIAVDFNKDIKPILETRCVSCHGIEKKKGDLDLSNLLSANKGGENGPAISPGKPEESELIHRITLAHDDDDIMPPKGEALTAPQIQALKEWISEEAKWPDGLILVKKDAIKPEDLAKEALNLSSVSIYPPQASLTTNADLQRVVAVATYNDGTTRDITNRVTFEPKDTALVTVAGNLIRPRSDGETSISIKFHDKTAMTPLKIQSASTERKISFRLDVMPVFLRSNCNTGSCHGSARGQDGFMLSLFGYDPAGDYYRITRQLSGRRINLAFPDESLIIEKTTESVPHTGGKLFEKGSEYYNSILSWLQAGVPDDPNDIPAPTSLEIYPKQVVLEGKGTTQQFIALATYSDGTTRDVTSLALFETNNAPSAAISKNGTVTAGNRGEAFVMARFATFTVGSQIIVIPENLDYQRPEFPPKNYIDGLVAQKIHKLRILPSDLCTDEEFLRRATIDITGTLPTEDEFTAFIENTSPDKRDKIIDTLLARKEFTEVWVMKFAELLQISTNANNQVSYKATLLYYNWLQERIANNVPFNKIVQELLSSTGGTFSNPSTNYYQIERDTLKLSENVAQVFMGMRLQCAQCHNHPFDRWTMNDYYSFAAFFSQIGRKRAQDPREVIVYNKANGDMKHPVGGRVLEPVFLGAAKPEIKGGQDRREILGAWMASPENPFFSRNLANIVWSHFFGIGIIDPVDDVRISNPSSNPELLNALANRFTEYNYDFKRLVKDICTSRTYQLSTKVNPSNEGDTKNFSHALSRRMRAEVLLDAISQITQTKNKFKGLPVGARAVQIADGNVSNYFLRTFGRAERKTVCSCEVKMEPNLGQALHLINGDATGNRIVSGKVVATMITEGKPPEQIIDSLYIRAFGRKPTQTERSQLLAQIDTDPKKIKQDLEDVFWALLNAKEFMFNH